MSKYIVKIPYAINKSGYVKIDRQSINHMPASN